MTVSLQNVYKAWANLRNAGPLVPIYKRAVFLAYVPVFTVVICIVLVQDPSISPASPIDDNR